MYAEISKAFMDVTFYLFFSYDITSESNIAPCNNIDKPLGVYKDLLTLRNDVRYNVVKKMAKF